MQTERSKKWLRLDSLAAIWLALLLGNVGGLNAQDRGPTVNPYRNDPAAIQKGRELFSASCGFCHGKDGNGGSRGSDLTTGQWKHGGTDAELFRNIAGGIAGTAMPAHKFSVSETWQLVAFLRSLSKDQQPSSGAPAAPVNSAPINSERLRRAVETPQDWLSYSGGYTSQRHSRLAQINTENVRHLMTQWVFQTDVAGQFEAVPLVYGGRMFFSTAKNEVYALDARTGQKVWEYKHLLPEQILGAKVNRGLAVLDDKLFMATLDGRVIALNHNTGKVVWNIKSEGTHPAISYTVAPLVVKDKVIVGVAGGDYGVRGFIDAYEAETGKRAWRFYTVPGPGEPGNETWAGDSWKRGGAPGWLTGSYDPKLNLVYWTTGNPAPDHDGSVREGDNLYSCSVVALDADTGRLKWHFQFTPHDVHDWDANQIPVLLDLNYQGRQRQLLALANRNGFFYLLDRTNGEFLFAKPFTHVTWAKEIGKDGRPVRIPDTFPTKEGTYVCPGIAGATNWFSPSFNPQTGLFYVLAREQCDTYYLQPQSYEEGKYYAAGSTKENPRVPEWGALRALDPRTGEIKWEHRYPTAPWTAGTLSTAGGLVFAGDNEGYLTAFNAATGKLLWRFQTGANIYASPMTYALDGKQYVAMPSGSALFTFALPDEITKRTTKLEAVSRKQK